ncbi:hypothetical protein HNR46_004090 [Haloferula luteola]|uniref:Uncharacterized protein n=1 Tax=Haloferula luteola TaxID=595692 RepID=A0A840V9R7_9BACT|nr:hypothetical protein [Haloferula luteola]MBB5353826.1 hypothetical protein [Haloferula luteola]
MPPALSLKSAKTGTQFACQRIYVTGSYPLGGQLECSGMAQLPPSDDRIFDVQPLGFRIEITGVIFESKKLTYIVK